ncbi:MAG: polysaccharide biosynthesis tyrosine autokinase [Nostoc sp. NMS1]|uniref:GumC family protein n=1 Tax=unclassified Nostoc TaxID=2593658 RepID=UPI0025FFCD23|nr:MULTISPECIES: polysaccharide biosynthesis tyrosine autokinase [unclassified Nostoc]MBN3907583.1 polysaccharide biosynthesis tyrosine autokinase [Nostoc sp. NMS1]MBN3992911.1 polysaccharide biosynthesis tyrosine autokinase [Nostoc sp. NMS2]
MESQIVFLAFDQYWQILKRRWRPSLAVFIPAFLFLMLTSCLKKPAYEAEGKLLFQRTNTISSLTGVGAGIGNLEAVAQDQKTNPLNTEAEIIRSVPLVQKTIDKLILTNDQGEGLKPKELLKKLTVKDIKGSDILEVSYKDINPEKSAKVVNSVMNIYLEYNVSSRRKEAAAARKFLQKELPKAELIVRNAEGELAKFQDNNKVVSLQEEATKSLDVITELQKQSSQVQSQIANVNAQSQDIRKQLNMNSKQALAQTSLSQSPGLQDILKEVQQLESQLAVRRTVLQESHPEIISLKYKLKALKNIIQQRVTQVVGTTQTEWNGNLQIGALQQQLTGEMIRLESTRLGLVSQAAALSKLQAVYKEKLKTLPRLEQQQRQLERKVQASQSTYSLLLQKLQESQIAENQNVGNASLIAEAEIPDQPISSNMLSYLSSGLLAVLATLATIYILEVRDKSIKTVDEAKQLIGLPLLGVIPIFSKPQKSYVSDEQLDLSTSKLVVKGTYSSQIIEAYRMLRTNLKLKGGDKQLKVIVVTSSVPREGKSTVAANLAIVMAQMEHQVLLIDGNLHRPVQHQIWELTNNQGLSNLILEETQISTVVKMVMNNLHVLTTGVVPPWPASLLDSKRMASLIQSFANNYDFVIIDAPSLNVAADAATLGQMTDGVLLVVRLGVVDSTQAAVACEILEKSGQNVLGQVVNAASVRG